MTYSFNCTPCGFAHPGECVVLDCGCKGKCKGHASAPPSTLAADPDPGIVPFQVTIAAGSRWRLEHRFAGSKHWQQVGFPQGYEVMAIVANKLGGNAIQMREWAAPHYPVYSCAIGWWDPDGIGASDGGRNRFVVWT